MTDWIIRNFIHSIVLDDSVRDADGELIDDYEKLVIALPEALAYIENNKGMVDYGTLQIKCFTDRQGFVRVVISVNVLPLS